MSQTQILYSMLCQPRVYLWYSYSYLTNTLLPPHYTLSIYEEEKRKKIFDKVFLTITYKIQYPIIML